MLKSYEKFKATETPWYNYVPAHWEIRRGKTLFDNPKVINKDNKNSNVLSLTLRGVLNNNGDKPLGLVPKSYDTYQLFRKDDLVFKLIDLENISTSRVGLVHEDGIMSPAYIRLAAKKNVELNIRYYYYQYYALYLRHIYNGLGAGVRQTLSGSELINLDVVIPPIEEQNQIVRFLDWKTSEMAHFVHDKRREIKLLKEYRDSLINMYITKGTKNEYQVKESIVDWIGVIPENWTIDKIKQHFSVRKRIAGKEGFDILSITQEGIKVKDISQNEGQMAQSYAGYQFVYPGDFAMNHMDLITGYVDCSPYFGVTSPDYRVFCLDDTENCYAPYYLRVFQLGYKRRIFYKFGKGAASKGRWRLPKTAFLNYDIPVPPIEEQKEIVSACEKVETDVAEIIDGIRKEISLVQELRTKTISDVVTGKVDVRKVEIPRYEPEADDLMGEEETDEDTDAEETVDEEVDE